MELGGEASLTMSWARLPGKWCHWHDNGWERMILGEATLGAGEGAIPQELGGGRMPLPCVGKIGKGGDFVGTTIGWVMLWKETRLGDSPTATLRTGGQQAPPRLNTSRRGHALRTHVSVR